MTMSPHRAGAMSGGGTASAAVAIPGARATAGRLPLPDVTP